MDPQVQASFIPKKPLTTVRGEGGGMGIFYLIAIFLFVLSLVAAGASFAYTQYLKSNLASKTESLARAQGAYEPGAIQDLVRLDARIINAKLLLDRHIAPSAVFALLSQETLEQVRFENFMYEPRDNGEVVITLEGVANSFATVALQSDQFGASKSLKGVIFSNITVDVLGRVHFSVTATVNPDVLLYRNYIAQTTPTPTAPTEEGATTPTP